MGNREDDPDDSAVPKRSPFAGGQPFRQEATPFASREYRPRGGRMCRRCSASSSSDTGTRALSGWCESAPSFRWGRTGGSLRKTGLYGSDRAQRCPHDPVSLSILLKPWRSSKARRFIKTERRSMRRAGRSRPAGRPGWVHYQGHRVAASGITSRCHDRTRRAALPALRVRPADGKGVPVRLEPERLAREHLEVDPGRTRGADRASRT